MREYHRCPLDRGDTRRTPAVSSSPDIPDVCPVWGQDRWNSSSLRNITPRAEVRAFLADALPDERGAGPVRPTSQENWPEQMDFMKKLAKKGWVAPAWPEGVRRPRLSHIKQMVFSEELLRRRARWRSRLQRRHDRPHPHRPRQPRTEG
ncbi:MAG: acyl-CoA dehydrogenase family protein [Dehalococcoidia bacterium]|nr:acyl-CoA dehydrogenase family protein [Dehalococcoidia bacterium]